MRPGRNLATGPEEQCPLPASAVQFPLPASTTCALISPGRNLAAGQPHYCDFCFWTTQRQAVSRLFPDQNL